MWKLIDFRKCNPWNFNKTKNLSQKPQRKTVLFPFKGIAVDS